MAEMLQAPDSLFADEIRALLAPETLARLPAEPVLFYGSSSIRLWETLGRDFAGLPVVNRGFGGSTLADCLAEMERLVFPLRPRALVLYAGDNDLDQGLPPEQLRALFLEFTARLRARLGLLPLIVISVKPSPSRFWNIARIRQANALLAEAAVALPRVRFVDLFAQMLTAGGEPRRELYTEDGLHMNAEGYQIWTTAVRAALAEFEP